MALRVRKKRGSPLLRRILSKWPGEKRFGMYRFLPAFFFLGAGLEYIMINWTVGETNFYKTYKKRQVINALKEEEERERAPR